MEEEICFSTYSLELTTVVCLYLSLAIVLAREDVAVRLNAPQSKTEHFWLCVWENYHLEKKIRCYEASGL
jgi:hypothetical protein